jgi:uncharacterized repeat protein (TIGR01451 family)/CSLREA domain-containing protein
LVRVPLLAALFAALALPSAASAATFNVTKTGDDLSCTPGDCSLRGAIQAANADPGADVINVPAGTYLLAQGSNEDDNADGDLDVREGVTINGAGAGSTIVDARGGTGDSINERVFDVQPQGGTPAEIAIRDLTVRGGRTDEGAGVRNLATLALQRLILTNNETPSPGFGAGGGVAHGSDGILRISDSTITANKATFGGGVAQNANSHSTTSDVGVIIERTTISGNRTVPGGEGDPDGAGIAINAGGDLHLRNSTVSDNHAEGSEDASGGGIYVNAGALEVTNSTISGNTVEGGYGGGIANTDGVITLLNATLADNSASEGGTSRRKIAAAVVTNPGDQSIPGGNIDSFGDANFFKNTIISGGEPQNCRGRFNTDFTSSGHNLESANTCGFDQSTDLTGANPQLGALANNGGPTQTRALAKGSPAVDSADNAACPSADQRGVARPQPAGGTCDRGAYERPAIDLAIAKLASATSVRVGEEVRFTLPVSNAGPGDATGVKVTDTLPDGLQFVSAQPSQGSCSGTTTITCDLGTLTADQNEDVVIRARATRTGDFTNTATVESDGNFAEPNTANNRASARVSATETTTECRDVTAPITELRQSRVRVRRHKVHLSGTTRDPDPCASGVNRVLVSMARVRGRHLINCRFIRSKTQYLLTFAPGMNCQDPVMFLAKGGVTQGTETASYSFIYFVSLPDGIYRAQARAWDNAGNKERPTKGRNIRKFFVR